MPRFNFTARDGQGTASTGVLDADNIAAVAQMLRSSGKFATSINAASSASAAASSSSPASAPSAPAVGRKGVKIPRADLIQFSMMLSVMIDTGVTLADALDCIVQQTDKPQTQSLVRDLIDTVRGGNDFSLALMRHPQTFPRLYIALVKASEKSGQMSKMLNRATAYLRDEQEIARKVKGALTYPAIMLSFAILATTGLIAFVLPKFTTIYASKGAALPTPTKLLMALSDFVTSHYIGLPVAVAATVISWMTYIRTPGGKKTLDYLQLNLPLIGPMFRKLHLARGLRMIGTMSTSGVTLVDCVHTARDLCGNGQFQALWDSVLEQIKAGRQMSEPLFASSLVPRSTSQMLHAAERSGKLATVMEQVANYNELELKEAITEMTRYIEPAMIVVMGIIIGGIAMAMLLPIFSISKVLH